MSLDTTIVDPAGNTPAKVTQYGELVVGDIESSTSVFQKFELDNTAYNFVEPKEGCDIFITGIILYANRS